MSEEVLEDLGAAIVMLFLCGVILGAFGWFVNQLISYL